MASKYDLGRNSVNFYAESFVNIDTLCSVYSNVQQSLGQTPVFKEKGENNKETDSQQNKVVETKNHDCDCKSCNAKCDKAKKFDFRLNGIFGDGDIIESDEDEDYICEFCGALGYGQKYVPEICDSCTVCASCTEYQNDECSGCSYSVYRDGTYYRDKMSETDLFSENDLETFNSLKLDTKGGEWLKNNTFTINKL